MGVLRLCLYPKDLNKAIKRNQWYCRTRDDVPPELAQLVVVSMTDTNSRYQQGPLNLASSLLATFNTPWGKFRFLKLPFGLKIAGDVLLQDGHPVVYTSRSLTPAEKQYSNIERELLAVVFAMERLHHYVYGYTVMVETDHKPLVSIW